MINRTRRRALIVAGVMLASAGLAVGMRPTEHMSETSGTPDLEKLVPMSFGDWTTNTGLPVILPSPDVQAALDKIYHQVLARTYINSTGERVMLSIAYGGDQSDATSAHRPEVCYPAQGFAISRNFKETLRVAGRDIQARRLMSQKGNRQEPITYWIVVGDEVVTTGVGQKLAQMKFGVRNIIADGLIIRVSTIDPDMGRGHKIQTEFLTALGPALDDQFAPRVLGKCSDTAPDGARNC